MTIIAHIHHLLLNYCTLCEHNEARSQVQRQRYLDRVTRILTSSRLVQRTEEQIWNLGWDKPFFAYNAAGTAGPAVERARAAGVFACLDAVASPQFMIGEVPGPLVEDAVARGHLAGACAVPFRLARVHAYARAVPRIAHQVNRFYDDWQAAVLGADELQERAVAIAEDIGVGGGPIGKVDGFGFTTACHLLADLGLPVFKPDIWVCRIVSALPGVRTEIRRAWRLAEDAPVSFDFLESKLVGGCAPDAYRRIVQPVMNALVRDAQVHGVAAAEFDLVPAFLRPRFVDWTLVHFAISAETEVYGLERRPVDMLRSAGELSVPGYLKALALWLDAGQASHEAVVALKNAEARVRRAKSPEQRERAQRRLALLRLPAAQTRRDELAAQAQAAWMAHEAASTAAGQTVAPLYPEGFARREPAGAWAYKRAALARRE
ncbi:hypothetical protein [Variovorax guangxiensis]|uniref:Uncharacterized protein n=1 Tax=Variovorax guangxiensis TaxID=1775474 RepID=A0A840G2Q9_9BURK|nr:hypothetical protein [Variovorax guangxiensis]MBB4226090.1 hypothetical protein [Variovorax guangxiensis]